MTKLSRNLLIFVCLVLSSGRSGIAQPTRQGGEFQINVRTSGEQSYAQVARDAAGNFIVVWADQPSIGSLAGDVFARRFDASGVPQGAAFLVNTYTSGHQYRPAVAVADAGHFVVVWQSYTQDGESNGVFGRRFSGAGAPLAVEFQVNTRTTDSQLTPDVGAAANGDFVVVWMATYQDGGGQTGLFGQRFQSGGARVGIEFAVNAATELNQFTPAVAVDDDGDFAVAWKNGFGDYNVVARRFNSVGGGGPEVQVNTYGTGNQQYPDLAMDSDGDFVVAWESPQESGSNGVLGRLFNSLGVPVTGEFPANTYTPNGQSSATVAMDSNGDFVIAWNSPQDGSSGGVFAQHFDGSGNRRGGEFPVNTYTVGNQGAPEVAMVPGGNFVVTWVSRDQDGANDGVFAQRFTVPKVLDIDGNGQIGALTDGLLVLRFMFGFTGTTLTSGAVDTIGCTRCNAAAIEPYLLGLV
jgi:hypothetical protein